MWLLMHIIIHAFIQNTFTVHLHKKAGKILDLSDVYKVTASGMGVSLCVTINDS